MYAYYMYILYNCTFPEDSLGMKNNAEHIKQNKLLFKYCTIDCKYY